MKRTVLLIFIITILATSVSARGKQDSSNIQEVRVSTAHNTVPVNGFRVGSSNYEIVNLPQYGRTNVIKVNRADCDWNVINYSLANYIGKTIIINFSTDVLRVGAGGPLNWQINNEPDYPSIAYIDNTESGVWHHMTSENKIITPSNKEPIFYLTTWGNNTANQTYYFDNINVTIRVLDYTPVTVLQTAGEANSNGARNYFVSAGSGSDNGNGTQARPFLKIAHAMYYVRPGDTVLLASGVYYEETLIIPTGSAGKPVTLIAMPGAEVIITSTVPITPQWRQHSKEVYVADINEYVKDMDTAFPQLFADRDSMVEARFPNMGPSMSTIHDYKREVAQKGTNKNTVVANKNIPSAIIGARLVICPGENNISWGTASSLVQSVSGRTIKLAKDITNKDLFTGGDPYTPHQGNPFYITGALAFLDAPGEYYFDPQTNLLYFYPPWDGSPDMRILTLRSKNEVVIYAENTSFVNIKNITVYGGGIFMKNTRNSTLENCHVNYAEHFYFNGDNEFLAWAREDRMIVTGSNNRIERCEFGPTAGNGIVLGGENNIFTNNIVHNTSYIGFSYYGIAVRQSKRLEISHNTIMNSAHSHIRFIESGSFEAEKYRVDYEHCIIRNNYFENHSTLNSDGGAFYAWGSDGGGTEIYNNFIVCGDKNDQGAFNKLRYGLYTDNYTSNYIVRNNIVIGGTKGLTMNLLSKRVKFNNNTVIGANGGISMYGYPIDNADANTSSFIDNLFVNIKENDIYYYAVENGRLASYEGNFVNGTIPVPIRIEGRVISSGNSRGTVDNQYRPTGNTPDIGAVPRGGTLFPYGADWSLGDSL